MPDIDYEKSKIDLVYEMSERSVSDKNGYI